ncbi:MAG: hypothetical protein R3F65_19650 [bacterium]
MRRRRQHCPGHLRCVLGECICGCLDDDVVRRRQRLPRLRLRPGRRRLDP